MVGGGKPVYPEENDRDLEEKYHVPYSENMDAFLCIDGIPKAPKARIEKLTTVLKTVIKTFGRAKEETLHICTDEEGNSKGYLFVEFEDPVEAEKVRKLADGHRLDKNHVFSAFFLNDIFKFSEVSDQFTPPPKPEFRERENFRYWLLDQSARDQFITLQAGEASVFWNMKTNPPERVHARQSWTDSVLQWSPLGSYLATFHVKGIALWGGPAWAKILRFPHSQVRLLDFSPGEEFMVTWSNAPFHDQDGSERNTIVWDVRTGKMLRTLMTSGQEWPFSKWSHDDKYLARVIEDAISIYETPTMGLLDKKSIIAPGVRDCSWSPKQNILAFWTPESGNTPARVTLMEMPSRNIVRTKNLFNVQDCRFYWQSEGEFLIVKVSRTKTKKSGATSLELFRMKEKGVPVEVHELAEENIPLLSWEPKGNNFILLCGEGASASFSFFTIEKTIKLAKTVEKKQMNRVWWSPKGQHVVVGSLGTPLNGVLEFWNGRDFECMGTAEHYMCTDVEWDPTGRFVTSVASAFKYSADTGYRIWDFKGKVLYSSISDKFYQFLWRPRPPTPLPKEKVREVKKNIAKYSAAFTQEDEDMDNSAASQIRSRRRKLVSDWKQFMDKVKKQYKEHRQLRRELRGCASDDEGETQTIEEIEEELISEQKTPFN